ncbi:MAG TPA: tyrosine-type recombinase/integrase [Xanthobacteraceae bacterium]|nr:tyrosine-type recombinase/integrase [Xanthobacteraceae bacterium]
MAELRAQEGLAAKALEFTILTAARSAESRGIPWKGEIDTADKVWTVPPRRMKGEREHRVPLTAPALAVIEYMRSVRQNDYVFPGDKADDPLSDMALSEVIRRMNEAREKAGLPLWVDPKQNNREVVPHGFRSSFKDWATDWAPTPEEIVEAAKRGELIEAYPRDMIEVALAHRLDSKTEEAYRRTDMFKKRRRMMEAWARCCGGPVVKRHGRQRRANANSSRRPVMPWYDCRRLAAPLPPCTSDRHRLMSWSSADWSIRANA